MTRRERLQRIFENKEVDRPALKLWGLSMNNNLLHQAYKPVHDFGVALTDIFAEASSPFDIHFGSLHSEKLHEKIKPYPDGNWVERHITLELPNRTLKMIHRESTVNEPSYTTEHFVKEPEDLRAILDMRYQGFPFDVSDYLRAQSIIDDKGIVIFSLESSAYAVQRLMGSELFALMCLDERDLIQEAVEVFQKRTIEHVKYAFASGIKPVFGWGGPELCIPPLVGMNEFEDLVFKIDKQICDLIHDGGGHTWIHCHGRIGKLLKRFMEMGCDVLNPLEPPPQGDITLKEAVNVVGNSMGLEGNVEISTLLLKDEDTVRNEIRTAVEEGSAGGRFILCPSAGYMEYPEPTDLYIRNLMIYLQYGLECVTSLHLKKY